MTNIDLGGTIKISKEEYKALTTEILDSLITRSNSPFNEMLGKFKGYLDHATGLDSDQKQAAYADLLKNTYLRVSEQALQTTMDLLKSNQQLLLESHKVTADYNMTVANTDKALEDKELLAQQVIAKKIENDILRVNLRITELSEVKLRAELERQWGRGQGHEINITDTTKTYGVYQSAVYIMNGNGFLKDQTNIKLYNKKWYKTNTANAFIKASDNSSITVTPDIDGISADNTVTPNAPVGGGVLAVLNENFSLVQTAISTNTPSIIDKQINGYDLVNLKDVLRSLDERVSLMQNAKVAETDNERKLRVELINSIIKGNVTELVNFTPEVKLTDGAAYNPFSNFTT